MHIGLIDGNLAKTSDPFPELSDAEPRKESIQQVLALGFFFERQLGTGEQAHCRIWLSNRSKTTRECIDELSRH
jgi:hypothetical protein